MKFTIALTLLALFVGCAIAQKQADAYNPDWWFHPHPFFGFPHFPRPAMPPMSDDQIKCSEAFHSSGMKSCLSDLHSSFQSHKISLGADCCSALENIQESCPYQSLFLKNVISHECSSSAEGPSA